MRSAASQKCNRQEVKTFQDAFFMYLGFKNMTKH